MSLPRPNPAQGASGGITSAEEPRPDPEDNPYLRPILESFARCH